MSVVLVLMGVIFVISGSYQLFRRWRGAGTLFLIPSKLGPLLWFALPIAFGFLVIYLALIQAMK